MSAGTSTLARANKKSLYELFKRVKRSLIRPDSNPDGLFLPFDSGNFTPVDAETESADDQLRVLRFPDGAKLYDLQIVSTAELDSGAAWVYDLQVDDDTTEYTLIANCTVGRGASDEDEMDLNTGYRFLDVGGFYLQLKTSTPPTGNTGTGVLRVKGMLYMGSIPNPSS